MFPHFSSLFFTFLLYSIYLPSLFFTFFSFLFSLFFFFPFSSGNIICPAVDQLWRQFSLTSVRYKSVLATRLKNKNKTNLWSCTMFHLISFFRTFSFSFTAFFRHFIISFLPSFFSSFPSKSLCFHHLHFFSFLFIYLFSLAV